MIRRAIFAAGLAAGMLATATAPALASPSPVPLPSVSVRPYLLDRSGPDRGQWFVFELRPGQAASERALIVNVAKVPETVSIFPRDLVFTANGSPELANGRQSDVGAWTTVATRSVTVPPGKGVVISFTVRVPPGASPGDHIGVLVVRSAAQRFGRQELIEQVATRLYVTVPGHVVPSMALGQVSQHLDSPLWPSSTSVTAVLRNTGRIRLSPKLTVNGHPAAGSTVLLARSAELYHFTLPVAWWGGHVLIRVTARAAGLKAQTVTLSLWVINWVLLAVVLILVLAGSLVGYEALRRRARRRAMAAERAGLQARLAELEAQLGAPGPRPVGAGVPVEAAAEAAAEASTEVPAQRTGNRRPARR